MLHKHGIILESPCNVATALEVHWQDIFSSWSPNANALFHLLAYPIVILLGAFKIITVTAIVLHTKTFRWLQRILFVMQVASHCVSLDK